MRKNIYTLVCLSSDRDNASSYVSRSFESLDDRALSVIHGCIEEDFENVEWDEGDSLNSHFLLSDSDIKALADGGYTEDFERRGCPVWECADNASCTTYLLHCSILEYKDVPVATVCADDIADAGFDVSALTDNELAHIAKMIGKDVHAQLFPDTLVEACEYEGLPKADEDVEKIKAYIKAFGTGEKTLELEDGPSWTFWDDDEPEHRDDNGCTDTVEAVRLTGKGGVEVYWTGERSSEGFWEGLGSVSEDVSESVADRDDICFVEMLLDALEEEFGTLEK